MITFDTEINKDNFDNKKRDIIRKYNKLMD